MMVTQRKRHKLGHGAGAKKHGRRYPWDVWFALPEFTLRKGRDYTCKTHGMIGTVRNVASRHGVNVQVSVGDDERTIVVTVVTMGATC